MSISSSWSSKYSENEPIGAVAGVSLRRRLLLVEHERHELLVVHLPVAVVVDLAPHLRHLPRFPAKSAPRSRRCAPSLSASARRGGVGWSPGALSYLIFCPSEPPPRTPGASSIRRGFRARPSGPAPGAAAVFLTAPHLLRPDGTCEGSRRHAPEEEGTRWTCRRRRWWSGWWRTSCTPPSPTARSKSATAVFLTAPHLLRPDGTCEGSVSGGWTERGRVRRASGEGGRNSRRQGCLRTRSSPEI